MPAPAHRRSRLSRRACRAWVPPALAALALALAGCGGSAHKAGVASSASASPSTHVARTTSARSGTSQATQALVVGLTTPSSPPRAGSGWPITVSAHTAAGRPVDGRVSYAFILGGAVVARRPGVPGIMRGGVYHDQLEFPPAAVGYPLTLEVIVQSHGLRGSTTRAVRVQR